LHPVREPGAGEQAQCQQTFGVVTGLPRTALRESGQQGSAGYRRTRFLSEISDPAAPDHRAAIGGELARQYP
ncbi:hypothetical protein, partial [Saezia sanguinis]|uniref:hypothetical protein n=1 Tax=Saezia sanguinis TaxID=1965230 RepID=UPI00194E18A8